MEDNTQNYKELKNTFAELQDAVNNVVDKEIKEVGAQSAETKSKLEKLSADFVRLETEIAQNIKAGKAQREAESAPDYEKKGLEKYLRRNSNFTAEESKAMRSDIGTDGGFLVAPDWETSIIPKLLETSPIRNVARVFSGSAESRYFPIQSATIENAIWEDSQLDASTEVNTPKFERINIKANTLLSKVLVTRQDIEDSFADVVSFLLNDAAQKHGVQENTAFISGDGVNKPKGFLTDLPTAQKLDSGSDTAFDGDDLYALMYQKLNSRYANNATWAFSNATLGYIATLKATTGNYLLQPGLRDGLPSTLLGKRFELFNDMDSPVANVFSAGNVPVALADWQNFYGIYDRVGMSVFINPYSAMPNIEYQFRKRVGGHRLSDERGVVLATNA